MAASFTAHGGGRGKGPMGSPTQRGLHSWSNLDYYNMGGMALNRSVATKVMITSQMR